MSNPSTKDPSSGAQPETAAACAARIPFGQFLHGRVHRAGYGADGKWLVLRCPECVPARMSTAERFQLMNRVLDRGDQDSIAIVAELVDALAERLRLRAAVAARWEEVNPMDTLIEEVPIQ